MESLDAPGLPGSDSLRFQEERTAKNSDAPGLPGRESRSFLERGHEKTFGCSRLARERITLVSRKRERRRIRMLPACPGENHVRFQEERTAKNSDAPGLPGRESRSFLRRHVISRTSISQTTVRKTSHSAKPGVSDGSAVRFLDANVNHSRASREHPNVFSCPFSRCERESLPGKPGASERLLVSFF